NLFIVQFDLNQLTGAIPTEAGLLENLGITSVSCVLVHLHHVLIADIQTFHSLPGYFTATGNNFSAPIPTELCGVPSEALVADFVAFLPAGE
ncbi:MAG: hypothetical protein ACK2UW_17110, partial [Anaerolineales bacterium]